jgi:CreA protein
MNKFLMIGIFGMALFCSSVQAEKIGEVTTTFKLLGANNTIMIEAVDDPDIPGATCFLSRAKTGGIGGSLGLAEDTSDASISCRQIGNIVLTEKALKSMEGGKHVNVFQKSTSILFKKLQVIRFYDAKRKVLIYLAYSDKLIDGSPKNSISIIPINIKGE